MINPPAPTLDFDGEGPSWKEVQEVVRKARASSAPGPSDQNVVKNVDQVITISLLGDEGNIFFSAATNDLLRNTYILILGAEEEKFHRQFHLMFDCTQIASTQIHRTQQQIYQHSSSDPLFTLGLRSPNLQSQGL